MAIKSAAVKQKGGVWNPYGDYIDVWAPERASNPLERYGWDWSNPEWAGGTFASGLGGGSRWNPQGDWATGPEYGAGPFPLDTFRGSVDAAPANKWGKGLGSIFGALFGGAPGAFLGRKGGNAVQNWMRGNFGGEGNPYGPSQQENQPIGGTPGGFEGGADGYWGSGDSNPWYGGGDSGYGGGGDPTDGGGGFTGEGGFPPEPEPPLDVFGEGGAFGHWTDEQMAEWFTGGGGPQIDIWDLYNQMAPAFEIERDRQISEAGAVAGFGGNRFGTPYMDRSATIGGETALKQNYLLGDLATKFIGLNNQQIGAMTGYYGMLGNLGQYEQGYADQYADAQYRDWMNRELGYLPYFQSLFTGQNANPFNQITAGSPGVFDYASQFSQLFQGILDILPEGEWERIWDDLFG